MLFNDKMDGRNLSILFKMSKDEKDFLIQEARRRGTSIVALLRKCLREKLVPRKRRNNVESRT